MISKTRFLAGLHELLYVEENFVAMLTNLTGALVRESEGINDVKKKEILNLLTILRMDSAKHKETMDRLIKKVEGDNKNEY